MIYKLTLIITLAIIKISCIKSFCDSYKDKIPPIVYTSIDEVIYKNKLKQRKQ